MKKRYFVGEGYEFVGEGYEEVDFKEFLAVDEEELVEKVFLANTVRVRKEHIENIEEYIIESIDSDESMELADAEEYLFLTLDELTSDEVYYLFQDGYIHLEELELLEYVPKECFDQLNMEEYKEWEDRIKKYLKQSIVAKMKADGFEASYLDSYIAYIYWDGSNMKEEDLSSEHSRWIDCTDELEGMVEVDRKQYNTGHDVLYTKDGSKVLVYTLYWQGQGESIAFLPSDIDTVDEAREYIDQREQDFSDGRARF